MSDQVPGTTRDGARTKSAINNYQASGLERREWRAEDLKIGSLAEALKILVGPV